MMLRPFWIGTTNLYDWIEVQFYNRLNGAIRLSGVCLRQTP